MVKAKHYNIANQYDKNRPNYPDKLIEDIINITEIKHNSDILEIGSGTGIATIPFIKKGYNIHCIEIGENLVNILKKKISNNPGIKIDLISFENWIPDRKYDLIFSAQAFHWIDINIKYKKTFSILKENGYLALFWYIPIIKENIGIRELNEFLKENKLPITYYSDDNYVDFINKMKIEIKNTNIFTEIIEKEYKNDYSIIKNDEYISHINTTSVFGNLNDDVKNSLNKKIYDILKKSNVEIQTKLNFVLFLLKI